MLRAVKSSLQFASSFDDDEVIVVDDASQDQTGDLLQREFRGELDSGIVRYLRNPRNLGTTASKNIGFSVARNKWVGFLDSDDVLLPISSNACRAALSSYPYAPIVFFRCRDDRGHFVGKLFEADLQLDLRTYVQHTSFGEAFTVVNRSEVASEPYIAELRGYEGLGCARIIARHGPAILSAVCVREYNRRGTDRLSSPRQMMTRLHLLAKGHRMMIREFGDQMARTRRCSLTLKATLYAVIGFCVRTRASL